MTSRQDEELSSPNAPAGEERGSWSAGCVGAVLGGFGLPLAVVLEETAERDSAGSIFLMMACALWAIVGAVLGAALGGAVGSIVHFVRRRK